ncbi:kinesin heavy chain [Radiomyces spectabilis]|uniref:kinesin heavy chain n=1 Tax=Radiomyces spectabilis TaxID=64574 RepID=UPI00221E3843|nr:kinesin heavy chain [Radiomyces spectabilis]KAI8375922.1 kinesin heavy chain [Radiomyces spectabilis]
MSGNNIKVVCRFRPQNKLEIREGGVPIIDIPDDGTSVTLQGKEAQGTYSFDKVFGSNTRQQEIFEYSIKSIVDDVVAGYNGTIFAYGQTGSGKTFTMMGSDIDDAENKGIIPRIVEQIFASIIQAPANMEFTVKVSYMEIYMEKVRDLLEPSHDNLPIHEDKTKGVYVKGLLEVYVSSTEEVYKVMKNGGNNRVVAYTNMNAESSRSHSIVLITITQKNLDTGAAKSGKLYLVDLAGSEKVGKTGASGQTLEEAKKINKSLTALGMVINALTDGKSSHVPYRDSKLTRILQESLGGNSRTTLIINCSPSSYNEAETISTLRFGVRAKSIKNKAKVNADLSPAELKALLKKVKSDAVSYQQYIAALEGEIVVWRSGGTVPEIRWVSMEKLSKGEISSPTSPSTPAPAFKAIADDSRPSTPAVVLEKDEREEFLKRENELVDQIAEKETELSNREMQLESLQEELALLKEQDKTTTGENQQMSSELNEMKLQLQKASYESKESAITADSLKEVNKELQAELEQLKQTLAQLRASQKDHEEEEKEKKKADKIALMMASLHPSDAITEKEQQIRNVLQKLNNEMSGDAAMLTEEYFNKLRQELAESKALLEEHEGVIRNLNHDKETLLAKRTELETRLGALEVDYEELLDKTIADEEMAAKRNSDISETISELKGKLESQYAAKKELQQKEIEELKKEVERKDEEYNKLNSAMTELKITNEKLQAAIASRPQTQASPEENEKELEQIRKMMTEQLLYFDVMKKGLMRDLQARCEKIVELEITLEETREQYNDILRASNNKAQQKKMAILERNLEQLTTVQKQLVEQNSKLKKDVIHAERVIATRNNQIQDLEGLLHDAEDNFKLQHEKLNAQVEAVREKLDQMKSQKSQNAMAINFGKIAKPLRGGGAVGESDTATSPVPEKRDKRSSWLPSFR